MTQKAQVDRGSAHGGTAWHSLGRAINARWFWVAASAPAVFALSEIAPGERSGWPACSERSGPGLTPSISAVALASRPNWDAAPGACSGRPSAHPYPPIKSALCSTSLKGPTHPGAPDLRPRRAQPTGIDAARTFPDTFGSRRPAEKHRGSTGISTLIIGWVSLSRPHLYGNDAALRSGNSPNEVEYGYQPRVVSLTPWRQGGLPR